MKAVQIDRYMKDCTVRVREVPRPSVGAGEVLVRVKAAAVNPVDILNITGAVKLIQNYPFPLTLGNECAGVVEEVGPSVEGISAGDAVYARVPMSSLGAFAEYVAMDARAVAPMPAGMRFEQATAIPLGALTAYQAITEELSLKAGDSLLITGASGSLGQVAVPIAKALGLTVYASGNAAARESVLAAGADRYFDYRSEDYTESLSEIDGVMESVGDREFERALSVLRKGGTLVSLRSLPNGEFARKNGYPALKRLMFSLAGSKYDRAAKRQGKRYRFLFVRADGDQLRAITRIVEERNIVPHIDPHTFGLEGAQDALKLVAAGKAKGKIVLVP